MSNANALTVACLIVRNEEKTLPVLLASIFKLNLADAVCVADTGSTDATARVAMDACEAHGIPCRVVNHSIAECPENFLSAAEGGHIRFGRARTAQLNAAREYVRGLGWAMERSFALFFDADAEACAAEGAAIGFRDEVAAIAASGARGADVVHALQGVRYPRTFMARLSLPWVCTGNAHECWGVAGPGASATLSSIFLDEHDSGGCRGNKGERESALLRADIAEGNDSSRNHFYLGRTERHMGLHGSARDHLRQCMAKTTWDEERAQAAIELLGSYTKEGVKVSWEDLALVRRAWAACRMRGDLAADLSIAYQNAGDRFGSLLAAQEGISGTLPPLPQDAQAWLCFVKAEGLRPAEEVAHAPSRLFFNARSVRDTLLTQVAVQLYWLYKDAAAPVRRAQFARAIRICVHLEKHGGEGDRAAAVRNRGFLEAGLRIPLHAIAEGTDMLARALEMCKPTPSFVVVSGCPSVDFALWCRLRWGDACMFLESDAERVASLLRAVPSAHALLGQPDDATFECKLGRRVRELGLSRADDVGLAWGDAPASATRPAGFSCAFALRDGLVQLMQPS